MEIPCALIILRGKSPPRSYIGRVGTLVLRVSGGLQVSLHGPARGRVVRLSDGIWKAGAPQSYLSEIQGHPEI